MATANIRMYRQGLGDCFLLTFPKPRGKAHVLIDCGVLKGTTEAQDRMRTIAADILKTTGGKLDVLVVTHEHWDHVSGFVQAKELLSKLKVGEVWMAWTEDPKDRLASDLRNRRKRALRAAQHAARRLIGATDFGARRNRSRLTGLLEFFGGLPAAGTATTAAALKWAKSRAGDKIRFLRPGETRRIPGVDRVRVYVMGPPHNWSELKRSDPSTVNSEVYQLALDSAGDIGFFGAVASDLDESVIQHPFEPFFRMRPEEAHKHRHIAPRYAPGVEEWRQVEHDWLGMAGRIALKLDSDTNNTSLALAFELQPSKRVLLFPGDAQVGNWMSWEQLKWTIKEKRRSTTVATRDLLKRTVLYKVGHHGSHNATMRAKGLELMDSDELVAMVPVDRRTAKKMKWKMPFPSLWSRLVERTRGRIIDADLGVQPPDTTPTASWKRFQSKVKEHADWIDYPVTM